MALKITIVCSLFLVGLSTLIDAQREGRIINGYNAKRGQFPSHVDMMVKNKDGSYNQCGGILISHTWVLTAAQCLLKAYAIEVRIGLTNKRNTKYYTEADHFILHEGYNDNTYKNDIALVHLHKALPKTKFIRPVPLPTAEIAKKNLEGQTGLVSGFGRTSIKSYDNSRTLKWFQVRIVDSKECQNKLGEKYEANMCAISVKQDQNICTGDNGGGLVTEVNGKKYVVGIALPTTKGCEGDHGMYENVGKYLEWIAETIKREDH